MASKLQQHDDVEKYLLQSGLQDNLLHCGFIATIRAVEKRNVEVVLPCGETRRIWYQIELPSSRADGLLQRWRKCFMKAQRQSAWIRFLGCQLCDASSVLQKNFWTMNEDSMLLEQCCKLDKRDLRIFETYCGSVGGWSRSTRWLHDNGYGVSTVGAGDWAIEAVETWNRNHLHNHEGQRAQILDFSNLTDWQKVVESNANVITVSSSCRSFSFAGRQMGWNSDDGRHLALTIAYASRHGFQLMLLENVAPLLQDKTFRQMLDQILSYFGYRIIYETCINISTFQPVDRSRAILVVCHETLQVHTGNCDEIVRNLFDDIPTSLWQRCRWLEIENPLREDAGIPCDAMEELSKFDRLPSFLKSRTFSRVTHEVLETRKIRSCKHIPSGTIMASYGNQHNLSENGTILGCIRCDSAGWRYLHPVEAILAMGVTGPVILPRSFRQASIGVGNSIAETHALVGLLAMLQATNPSQVDVPLLIQLHADQCLASGHVSITWDENWIEIKPIRYIPDQALSFARIGDVENDFPQTYLDDEIVSENASTAEATPAPNVLNLAISWQDIRIEFKSHFRPDNFSVQGMPFCDIPWKSDKGTPWKVGESLLQVSQLHTSLPFPFAEIDGCKIRVFRVTLQDVTWQDVDFSEGTTVEDLWRAEQILLGPTEKVEHPCDCVGGEIDINMKLSSGMIIVFHMFDVGDSVFIDLCKDEVKTRIYGSKGDRLFQFFHIKTDEWIEDECGFTMQRDFPVHHPIKIMVRQEKSDISPTIGFDIIPEPDLHPNLPIQQMANQEMNDPTLQYATFALDRWKTMDSFQEMMGDDEMAFMLSYAEEKSGIGFAGIYQWDEELGLSKKDSGTSKLAEHKYGSRLGALVIRNHWIPSVVTHGTDFCSVVDYGHYEEIPKPILKQLCLQIFGHPRVIGHWVELHPEPGWCGFDAVSWMLGKFATPVYARSIDEIQPHILQIQEIAGVDLWSKIWNIEQRCPSDRWKWVILLRHEFIISQITSPTVPVLHAGGQEDAAMLKARGKIASVLISKGHQAKESIEIAETISRQLGDSKQVKQFAHQKEESIYHGVIERCQKSGIPISQAAQLAAAEKLQKFFRSKQQAKKSPTINFKLHDVTFPANAFTNPNGDPLMVQENWTIVTRGVAIADPAEVQEVADAGRLVSTECCGALTLTAIKANGLITSELITVQVTDAFQNKALIRVFLTQLGSKKVMKVPAKDIEIKLSPLRTLAFSVHKCLVDEPFWLALMKGPAKAILESMAIGPEQKINQIYSRRWTAKGRVVEKQDAEEFGMLCLVEEAATKTWLARSGTDRNPIFISGKRQNDAHPEEAHRVIWSGKCIKDALIQIALIQDHAGIVYKPPGSFGIRVQTSRFASAWVELKGSGIDIPSQVHSTYKYVFEACPQGCPGHISNPGRQKQNGKSEY